MQPGKRLSRSLYALLFLGVWGFLFWKCRYGFAYIDESFYLTIPYRFCQGDSFLTQEWHLSQTAFLLLMPIMRLQLALFGGTAGILLHFRWVFTLVWGLSALFFYFRLRIFSDYGAMAASLVFLLYTPFGIMALSYNSLAILLLLLTGVLIVSARSRLRLQYYFAGLSLAGAVLSSPLLLSLYLLLSVVTAILFIRKKQSSLYSCWLFISLGAATAAALFLIVFFAHSSLSVFFRAFPLMMADPDHVTYGLLKSVWRYCAYIYLSNRYFPYLLLPAFLAFYLGLGRKKVGWGFVVMSVTTALYLLSFRFVGPWYINQIMFPLNLLGLYCVLCSRDRTTHQLFSWIYLPGLVYSFCINITSNQEFYAIASASTVMTVVSAMIVIRFVEQLPKVREKSFSMRRLCCGAAAVLLLLQLGMEASLRYTSIFWDSDMRAQTVMAADGPEKGILMRPERLEEYEVLRRETQYLTDTPAIRKVLFLSDQTWLYLNAEKENSAFSAWLSGINETCLARLDQYYALFPQKLPDAIYIDVLYCDLASHFESMGYVSRRTPAGACILTRPGISPPTD